ncbi:MAG: PD40 domain-containing protein [Planctomycetes bacterium]|nr:PD40 domain-containing protein [Planctomycetota bacterium]
MTPFRLLLIALLAAPVAAQVLDRGYVSHRAGVPGNTGNASSQFNTLMEPGLRMISDDGRYSVFSSHATNLVAGQVDVYNTIDAFWHDRATGQTKLVSHSAISQATSVGGASVSISADGQWVSFVSAGSALMQGQLDTNNVGDVFLWEAATGEITLVSHAAGDPFTACNNASIWPAISADGNTVAYVTSATNLQSGVSDNNSTYDLYVFDRVSGSNTLISHIQGDPLTSANGWSSRPVMSANAAKIAFASKATNLVSGQVDTNNEWDAFHYDRTTQTVALMSTSIAGPSLAAGNAPAYLLDISDDGRYAIFVSIADDIAAGVTDANTEDDLFLYDANSATVVMITRSSANPTQSMSVTPSSSLAVSHARLSRNGQWVAFSCRDSDVAVGLIDNNDAEDVFLYDVASGTSELVSRRPNGSPGNGASTVCEPSADGQTVMFLSLAQNLVYPLWDNNASNDVYRWNRTTGSMQLLSGYDASHTGLGPCFFAFMSADGSTVVFNTNSPDIIGGDGNGASDVIFVANSTTPRLNVSRDGVAVAHNSVDQNPPGLVTGITLTYSIENSGGGTLTLTGSPHVEIANTTNCIATVTQAPASQVATLGSTTFQVLVMPQSEGIWSLNITIWSNSTGPNPYAWLARGSVASAGTPVDEKDDGGGSDGGGCVAAGGLVPVLPALLAVLLYRRRRRICV